MYTIYIYIIILQCIPHRFRMFYLTKPETPDMRNHHQKKLWKLDEHMKPCGVFHPKCSMYDIYLPTFYHINHPHADKYSGWWFGAFFIFPFSWEWHRPN